MNLTTEQKEIIRNSIENFDKKFMRIKEEFTRMGYKENDDDDDYDLA